jgi:hypothetical protein
MPNLERAANGGNEVNLATAAGVAILLELTVLFAERSTTI